MYKSQISLNDINDLQLNIKLKPAKPVTVYEKFPFLDLFQYNSLNDILHLLCKDAVTSEENGIIVSFVKSISDEIKKLCDESNITEAKESGKTTLLAREAINSIEDLLFSLPSFVRNCSISSWLNEPFNQGSTFNHNVSELDLRIFMLIDAYMDVTVFLLIIKENIRGDKSDILTDTIKYHLAIDNEIRLKEILKGAINRGEMLLTIKYAGLGYLHQDPVFKPHAV